MWACEHDGVVLRNRLRRDARHGRDRRLDFLDADGLLALRFRDQHLRGTRLVDHIDRLVRQFAVVNIAHGKIDRRLDRFIGVAKLVIILEVRLQALEDFHRVFRRGFVHVDLLEAAHKRAVLFEVLAIFLVGRGADATDRAGGQCGLQEVGRIHRAAGSCSRADHGVNFVDEHDCVGMRFEFLDDLLETLFEVAAVARACKQRAHVERKHGRAAKHFGHVFSHDAEREAFRDRGLADAGISDIKRVVLLAAA